VLGDRGPAFVVDAAVAHHLEVLGLTPFGRTGVVERVRHAHSVQRHLLEAVDEVGLREPCHVEHRGGDVDHVVELGADLALGLDAIRPVDDCAIAGAAPVRRHLLGPLVGGAHRVGPAHRIVVVGGGGTDVVDVGDEVVGRLELGCPVEQEHLVDAAVDCAFGTRAVVADDVVDERVVEDLEVVEGVEQPADVEVRVLEEPGIDLHLALEDRPELLGHVVVRRDLVGTGRQLGIGRDDP
jgi:hypothetical protein